jgi:plastocyanin
MTQRCGHFRYGIQFWKGEMNTMKELNRTAKQSMIGRVIFLVVLPMALLFTLSCGGSNDVSVAASDIDSNPGQGQEAPSDIPLTGEDGHLHDEGDTHTGAEEVDDHESTTVMVDGAPEIEILGNEFKFLPDTLTLTQGEPVTLIFTNDGIIEHNIVIDELEFSMDVHEPGETYKATLIPEKTGTFIYYCSVPGHKDAGMLGTLIVEPLEHSESSLHDEEDHHND